MWRTLAHLRARAGGLCRAGLPRFLTSDHLTNDLARGDTMVSNTIDACPFCEAMPTLTGRWRFQVHCNCGACGPKMHTPQEAISRWSSVVHFIGKWRRDHF